MGIDAETRRIAERLSDQRRFSGSYFSHDNKMLSSAQPVQNLNWVYFNTWRFFLNLDI